MSRLFPSAAPPETAPMPEGPIGGPAAWYGAELTRSESWIHHLTPADVAELEAAASIAGRRGRRGRGASGALFPGGPERRQRQG